MKGVGADAFIQTAIKSPNEKKLTFSSPGEPLQSPVNTDTIGGISGLSGESSFEYAILGEMAPAMAQQGKDEILSLMSKSISVINPDNLGGPNISVNELSTLDGSSIVNLLRSVSQDLEWDLFLSSHIKSYLGRGDFTLAYDTALYIQTPLIKVRQLIRITDKVVVNDPHADLKFKIPNINAALAKLNDVGSRIRLRLNLAKRLGNNGFASEPYDSMKLMEKELERTKGALNKSIIAGHLALAYVSVVDRERTQELFSLAIKNAGDINDKANRISAFTLMALRYYDVRNVTIANEILTEAQQFAATDLPSIERSQVFGKIALAQLYLDDLDGAFAAIGNASRDKAKDQLIVQLSESLIRYDRTYLARKLLNEVDDALLYHQLALKISTRLYYDDARDEAAGLLGMTISTLNDISSTSQRCLIMSHYARLSYAFWAKQSFLGSI